jgi:hypothetical protein
VGFASDYHCSACGYSVDEMVSGYSVGMASHVVGVSCYDCKELRVAQIPGHPAGPGAFEARSAIELGQVPAGVRCPKSVRHRVAVWEAPGPCPRCGKPLDEGDQMMMWD